MECPRCATENVEGAEFCQICGYKIDEKAQLAEYDLKPEGYLAPIFMEEVLGILTSLYIPGGGWILGTIFYRRSKIIRDGKSAKHYRVMALLCLGIGSWWVVLLLVLLSLHLIHL